MKIFLRSKIYTFIEVLLYARNIILLGMCYIDIMLIFFTDKKEKINAIMLKRES